MVQAQVLYSNILRAAAITYSDTPIVGFEPANAYDWRDFSIFRTPTAAATTRYLTLTVPSDTVLDTLCIWTKGGSGAVVATLQYNSGSGWVTMATASISGWTVDYMTWLDFTQFTAVAGSSLRVALLTTAQMDYRQITVGSKLQFPIGQWADVAPPTLYSGVVLSNVIAENGSILGRNVRRAEKKGEISLDLLMPDWVRTYWDPFARNCARYPFWYRWDPLGHPDEIAFAAAESIQAPVNSAPQPRMSVSMPMRLITP